MTLQDVARPAPSPGASWMRAVFLGGLGGALVAENWVALAFAVLAWCYFEVARRWQAVAAKAITIAESSIAKHDETLAALDDLTQRLAEARRLMDVRQP